MTGLRSTARWLSLLLLVTAGCSSSGVEDLQGTWSGEISCQSISSTWEAEASVLGLILRIEQGQIRGDAEIRSKGSNLNYTLRGIQDTSERLKECATTCNSDSDCSAVLDESGKAGNSRCPTAGTSRCQPCYRQIQTLSQCINPPVCTGDAQCTAILDQNGKTGNSRCSPPRFCSPCYELKLTECGVRTALCTADAQCAAFLDQNGKAGNSHCVSSVCWPCYQKRFVVCDSPPPCTGDSQCKAVLDQSGRAGNSQCLPVAVCKPCYEQTPFVEYCTVDCSGDADCAALLDKYGKAGTSRCVAVQGSCSPCFENQLQRKVTLTLRHANPGVIGPEFELWRFGDRLMEGNVKNFCAGGQTSKVTVNKK